MQRYNAVGRDLRHSTLAFPLALFVTGNANAEMLRQNMAAQLSACWINMPTLARMGNITFPKFNNFSRNISTSTKLTNKKLSNLSGGSWYMLAQLNHCSLHATKRFV